MSYTLKKFYVISCISSSNLMGSTINYQLFWNDYDKEFGKFGSAKHYDSREEAEQAWTSLKEENEYGYWTSEYVEFREFNHFIDNNF